MGDNKEDDNSSSTIGGAIASLAVGGLMLTLLFLSNLAMNDERVPNAKNEIRIICDYLGLSEQDNKRAIFVFDSTYNALKKNKDFTLDGKINLAKREGLKEARTLHENKER